MYRSRMGGGKPDSRVLDYLSSAGADSKIIQYDVLGSQAHVLMLYKKGIIPRDDARRILDALADVWRKRSSIASATRSKSTGYGNAEDIHEFVELFVIERAGIESGGRIHAARSRNDQVATDIRMKIRDDINEICGRLLDVAESMIMLGYGHCKTIMPLYTHMQQAQVGLFSHWLLAHVDALLRDYDRLCDVFGRVNMSPLGAGPVGGTSLPIDRQYTAKLLGFDGLVENSLDATSTRDFAAEYASAVSIMMSNISRIAEDLVVWSTSEFSFVELEDCIASPSSAMPQKKNPDILEVTRAKSFESAGCLASILGIVGGLASGYGRDLQQLKPILWQVSDIGSSALFAMYSVFGGLYVDKARMRRVAQSSDLISLDVAEKLVIASNVPFRTAHAVAASLARHAHDVKKPVRKLAMSEIKKAIKGMDATGVDAQDLCDILSTLGAVSSLRNRLSRGSSGYAEQTRMLADRKKRIADLRGDNDIRVKRILGAFDSLQKQARHV